MHYMRSFVATLDPEVPASYGRVLITPGEGKRDARSYQSGALNRTAHTPFLSGGAGQLVSRAALRRLIEAARLEPSRVWDAVGGYFFFSLVLPLHSIPSTLKAAVLRLVDSPPITQIILL